MAKRHEMMADHMAMMQTTMDMMAERMPPASTGK
jgi:DNA-binding ferritin-like protein